MYWCKLACAGEGAHMHVGYQVHVVRAKKNVMYMTAHPTVSIRQFIPYEYKNNM